jgi:hypothetical protein
MNYFMENVRDVYTLRGSFALPVGNVEKNDSGCTFKGDGYEVTTTVEKHWSGVCKRKDVIKTLETACKKATVPTAYKSLSEEENKLMGAFLALEPEEQRTQLLALVRMGTEKLQKRRKEMF